MQFHGGYLCPVLIEDKSNPLYGAVRPQLAWVVEENKENKQ